MQAIGKSLVVLGMVIVAVGAGMMFFDKIPFLGKLPGDISFKRGNVQFYFPIVTGIVLSIVISLLLWIASWFRDR